MIYAVGAFETLQLPIVIAAILIAILVPRLGSVQFSNVEKGLRSIADRPILSSILVGASAILARLSLIPFLGTTQVIAPDEGSILLQAQTYVAGHFGNHGAPLPPSFESFYVILQPVYASMYPVLRAAPMALTHLVGLGYWAGILLTMAALAVATYWLIRAFRLPGYGLVCALLIIFRYGLFSFWVNSYESAAFTALGGVLLVLGYKRLSERSIVYAVLFGLGLFILMTTRPFEGFVFSLPFLVAVAWRAIDSRAEPLGNVPAVAIGVAVFVGLGLGLTLYSNQLITGSWRMFPYNLYRTTYAQTPAFLFEHLIHGGSARYDLARRYLDLEAEAYFRNHGLLGVLNAELMRLRNSWNFYVGFALLIPFLAGLQSLRNHKVILASVITLGAGLAVETWGHAHYASPLFGVILLTIAFGFGRLRNWTPHGKPLGAALGRMLVIGLVLGELAPLWVALSHAKIGNPTSGEVASSCCWIRPTSIHSLIDSYLEDLHAGKRIVFVDTGPRAPLSVIIYNDADLQDAKTIWANADPVYDASVRARFPGREAWRLDWAADRAACLTRLDDPRNVRTPKASPRCFEAQDLLRP